MYRQDLVNLLTDVTYLAKRATHTAQFGDACRRQALEKLRTDHSQKEDVEFYWRASRAWQNDADIYWRSLEILMEIMRND